MDAQVLLLAVADLARAATGDFAVEHMLGSLCDAAGAALDVDGAGVMICEDGCNRFVHATSPDIEPLELLQEVLQAGPCKESWSTNGPIIVANLSQGNEWWDFRRLSAELHLGSMLAMPLVSRGRVWGVLDLYRKTTGQWLDDDQKAAQTLADVAVSYIVMAHDRDEARLAQLTLAHRAMHDSLTGLANRALLFDRLDHALGSAGRRQAGVAVLFLDLDLFKGINDAFGHTVADAVLVEVAARLSQTLRTGDTLARFAGDEFVIVCEGLPKASIDELILRVDSLTSRLQSTLRAPIQIDEIELVLSVSIGVAITTNPMTAQELIAEADTAMYAAKAAGRGRISVRDHTAVSAVGYARQLERDLAGALERGELAVYYQPIFAARTHELAGVEALLRWDQPNKGVLPAAAFIDIAVRSGLIGRIGRWVIDEICVQMARWQSEDPEHAPGLAFVNLSARELLDPTLPAAIEAALSRNDLRPTQLGLEIVEDDLADTDIVTRLNDYSRRGHLLSVADFGTGYSSLSRLVDLPIGLAKIDKSFVAGIPEDTRRASIIHGILTVAASLGIEVVAEGVETNQQAEHLSSAGVQFLQGYHLASPQTAAQLANGWRTSPDPD